MASVAIDSLSVIAARLVGPATSFLIHVGIARMFGAENLGAYVALISLGLIFQTAAGAGMSLLLTRDLAAHPGDVVAILRRARSFAILSGTAATVVMLIVAALILEPSRLACGAALAATVLPSAWIAVQESYFFATKLHYRVAIISLSENVLKLTAAGMLVLAGGELFELFLAVVGARLAALVVGHVLIAQDGTKGSWKPSFVGVAEFARTLGPFAALLTFTVLFFRSDILVVQSLLGEEAAGIYAPGLALYGFAMVIPDGLMAAVYPRFASQYSRSDGDFVPGLLLSLRFAPLLLVPVSLVLICFAEPMIRLLYGDAFARSATILQFLAMGLPIHAVSGILGNGLQAAHHQSATLRVVIGVVPIHLVLLGVLVTSIGPVGAAIAVPISAALCVMGNALVLHWRVVPGALEPRLLARCAGLTLPMGLALYLSDRPVVALAASALALGAAAVLTGLIRPSDRNLLRGALWS